MNNLLTHFLGKKNRTINSILLASLSVLIIALTPSLAAAAADGTESLGSANPSTVIVGNTFTVKVSANTGSTSGVNIVGSRVVFDASKLQFVSVDYAGAEAMTATPDEGPATGYFQFSRYTATTMAANHAFTVGTLTFRATTSSGSSALSIDKANSYLTYTVPPTSTADALGSVSGATVSFQAAPATPSPSPNPTPTPGTPTPSPTPATPSTKPTTPSTKYTAPTPSPTPTPAAVTITTPEGDPVPSVPVAKKSSTKLLAIGGGSVVILALAAGAIMVVRKRSMMGMGNGMIGLSNSHTILNQPQTPVAPFNPSISKIPSVETRAPGEVIQPRDPNGPPPPVG